MTRPLIALALSIACVLFNVRVQAQDHALPPIPPPPSHYVSVPEPPATELELPTDRAPRSQRVLYEALAWSGTAVGYLLLLGGVMAIGGDDNEGVLAVIGTMGVGIGLLGLPCSVYLAGRAAGADGSYAASLLGHVIGALVGSIVTAGFVAPDPTSDAVPYIGMGLGVAVFMSGSILGFELSSSTGVDAGPRIAPYVSPTADLRGGTTGIMGTF